MPGHRRSAGCKGAKGKAWLGSSVAGVEMPRVIHLELAQAGDAPAGPRVIEQDVAPGATVTLGRGKLGMPRDEMMLSIEDGVEMPTFLLAEIAQLKSVVDNTREEVRQELDISKEKDRRFANAGAELAKTKQLMTEEKDFAVAFEANEREKMRLALTEIIVQRESTITELCVVISDTRTEANTLVSEVARLEGQVAVMTEELAEAVVPIVVTVEEQQAVAETVEEMITLIELLDRVDSRQTQLYPSGAATTNTPQPTATPDIVEHDYSRAMANPVVSVRMVRGKRLFSI